MPILDCKPHAKQRSAGTQVSGLRFMDEGHPHGFFHLFRSWYPWRHWWSRLHLDFAQS